MSLDDCRWLSRSDSLSRPGHGLILVELTEKREDDGQADDDQFGVQLRGVQAPKVAADGQGYQREHACHESSTKIRTKSRFQGLKSGGRTSAGMAVHPRPPQSKEYLYVQRAQLKIATLMEARQVSPMLDLVLKSSQRSRLARGDCGATTRRCVSCRCGCADPRRVLEFFAEFVGWWAQPAGDPIG